MCLCTELFAARSACGNVNFLIIRNSNIELFFLMGDVKFLEIVILNILF